MCTHAKLLQSCPTLCDPTDCSPPGSSVYRGSPGKNTGVGCHAFIQGIFATQGSNPGLLNCRRTLYLLSHQGRNAFILGDTVVFLLFPVTSTIYATGSQTCIFQTLPSFWSADCYMFPGAHFIWPVGMPAVGWCVQWRYPLENIDSAYLRLNSALQYLLFCFCSI